LSKVVDTCVLLDILDGDSDFSTTSAVALNRHVREGLIIAPKRPIADILIGALAVEYGGLITRNPKDFSSLYPDLEIIVP